MAVTFTQCVVCNFYFIFNHNSCSPKVEHQQMCPFQFPLTVLDNIPSALTLVNRCLDIQPAETSDTGHI